MDALLVVVELVRNKDSFLVDCVRSASLLHRPPYQTIDHELLRFSFWDYEGHEADAGQRYFYIFHGIGLLL